MKPIRIRKIYKQEFLKAAYILHLNVEELKVMASEHFIYFRIYSLNQNDIFKLGRFYSALLESSMIYCSTPSGGSFSHS